MEFKLVIFDIDGTLIDSEETGVRSLMQTIRELTGLEVSYEEAYRWFGISSADVSRDVHFDDAVAFGERWEENFVALTHLIKPFPGALELVAAIHEAGFRTGIVTARNHFEFDKDVHIKPFLKYIDHIVCADDTARRKPDPEPMRHCVALASAAALAGTAGTAGAAAGSTDGCAAGCAAECAAGCAAGCVQDSSMIAVSGAVSSASSKGLSPILPSEAIYFGDTIYDFRCADGAGCSFALADWRARGLQGIPAPFHFTSAAEALALLGLP